MHNKFYIYSGKEILGHKLILGQQEKTYDEEEPTFIHNMYEYADKSNEKDAAVQKINVSLIIQF